MVNMLAAIASKDRLPMLQFGITQRFSSPILLLELVIAHQGELYPLPSVHVVAVCTAQTADSMFTEDFEEQCCSCFAKSPLQLLVQQSGTAGKASTTHYVQTHS